MQPVTFNGLSDLEIKFSDQPLGLAPAFAGLGFS